MNSEWFSRSQEKLHFCRMALELHDRLAAESALQQPARTRMLVESAVFHLYGAWLAFVQEMAHAFQLDVPEGTDVRGLQGAAAQSNLKSSALEAMMQLADAPDSWLRALWEAWAQCQVPRAAGTGTGADGEAVRQLIQSTRMSPFPGPQAVAAWAEAFESFAAGLRDQQAEW